MYRLHVILHNNTHGEALWLDLKKKKNSSGYITCVREKLRKLNLNTENTSSLYHKQCFNIHFQFSFDYANVPRHFFCAYASEYVRVYADLFVAVTMGQGTDGESVCMSSATAVDWRSVSDPA